MSESMKFEATDLGRIEIAPEVIQVISGLAAAGVDGVYSLSGGMVGDIHQLLGKKSFRKGVRVELNERINLEIAVILNYGVQIPDVGKEVQEKVKAAVESMTSLDVDQVLVRIEGIRFPQAEGETPQRTK